MTEHVRYGLLLGILSLCAFFLAARIVYTLVADANHFPVHTVKIIGQFDRVSREELKNVLSKYLQNSFFLLPLPELKKELLHIPWVKSVEAKRIWPDTLRISFTEQQIVACWNGMLLTTEETLFGTCDGHPNLPFLRGPLNQQKDVLQNYKKLSKLLTSYGLKAHELHLRHNQAWELTLTNGILVRLGKQEIETRLLRFLRAYPAVIADKPTELATVDLRYARGMALQWK